jgi:hypothetical protein
MVRLGIGFEQRQSTKEIRWKVKLAGATVLWSRFFPSMEEARLDAKFVMEALGYEFVFGEDS